MRLKKLILDGIFPRRCPICDEVIGPDERLCPECAVKIRPIQGDTCLKCGKPLSDSERMRCFDCSRKIHEYDRGFSVFAYEDVRNSLYRFKYKGRVEYASFYAYAACRVLGQTILDLKPDALIPVPVHKRRLKSRGYNQAYEFAKEISNIINVPVRDDICVRTKATIPLKNLNEKGRRNNLKKAFTMRSNDVKLKTIVIIDDIYTTGSTIDAISARFRELGVERIYFLTVAIGRGL